MARIVSIKVPKDVSERDVIRWVAEGLSRRIAKKLILRYLEGGMDLDLESALKEFEETRSRYGKNWRRSTRRRGCSSS